MINDRQLYDVACIKLLVLCAMHFIEEAWRLITLNYQELFCKMWFSGWSCPHRLLQSNETQQRERKSLAQFATSWSAAWGLNNMWQCSQGWCSPHCQPGIGSAVQTPEKAEHEVAEDEVTFLDTLRRLRSSQKEHVPICYRGQWQCNLQQGWKMNYMDWQLNTRETKRCSYLLSKSIHTSISYPHFFLIKMSTNVTLHLNTEGQTVLNLQKYLANYMLHVKHFSVS